MRILTISSAIILSLLLSHTAVQAQDKLDEFESFRAKLNKSNKLEENKLQKMIVYPDGSQIVVSPDDADTSPLVANSAKALPVDTVSKENAAAAGVTDFADKIVAESKITAVTVFSNRAKVTRTAEVDIPAGAQTVVFKDMPSRLMTETLRADGSSKAAVQFGALSSKKFTLAKLVHPRERELRDTIKKLRAEAEIIQIDNAALATRITFIDEGKTKFLEGISKDAEPSDKERVPMHINPEAWLSASETFAKGIRGLNASIWENNQKINLINEEIARIESEISQFATGEKSTFAVLVPIVSDKAGKLKIELSYQIPRATWKPIYDARLSTETGKLELTQYGEVHQVTGEDWKDVELTLSTAQPQRGAQAPVFSQPWWVNAREKSYDEEYKMAIENENERAAKEAAQRGGSAMPIPIGKPQDDALTLPPAARQEAGDPLQEWRAKAESRRLALEDPEMQVSFQPASIQTGGFISEYKIPGASTVPSDGTQTKLLVGAFDAESKLNVHIKPQLSNEAFLIVSAKLKGESPVLPGLVNLFRDGAFTGQAMLPMLRPGEDCEISFGVDDQVTVKHKMLKDESKEEGLIDRDKVLERQYVTEIQNLHSVPVTVIVKQNTPVPRNEKIKIAIQPQSTEPGYKADADNIKGLLAWELELQPKDKKELKLGWSVNWPKDHTLSGL